MAVPDTIAINYKPTAAILIAKLPNGALSGNSIQDRFQSWPDGRFIFKDVPAGEYHLHLIVFKDRQRIAVGDTTVKVTIDATHKIDLGEVKLQRTPVLDAGQAIPETRFKDTDGKAHDLADYRGHWVLLDFWATWCGACIAKIPEVKAVQEEFAADGKLVVIGISLDIKPEKAGDYAKNHNLKWVNGILPAQSDTGVLREYNISAIPQTLLIDPEGRLFARDLQYGGLRETIAKALAQPADQKASAGY